MRIPPAVREAVKARSGGVCETCHQKRATQMHHIEGVGMGGCKKGPRAERLSQKENIRHQCFDCHIIGEHS